MQAAAGRRRVSVEFKEVLGIRRSIRFFDPDRPVEREKIQKILEAMRIASCAVNAHSFRNSPRSIFTVTSTRRS
jgi:nitroreductase